MPIYEHRSIPPLTRAAFALRILLHSLLAFAFVGVALGAGMLGYLYFENEHVRTWPDAFLNVAMLLGGMGPIHSPGTEGGKGFAGLYALYAGLVFHRGRRSAIRYSAPPIDSSVSLGSI